MKKKIFERCRTPLSLNCEFLLLRRLNNTEMHAVQNFWLIFVFICKIQICNLRRKEIKFRTQNFINSIEILDAFWIRYSIQLSKIPPRVRAIKSLYLNEDRFPYSLAFLLFPFQLNETSYFNCYLADNFFKNSCNFLLYNFSLRNYKSF